jgi:hypothetical protein
VPGDVLFKEDFFERVHDIQWTSEKKCYFMAGDSDAVKSLFSVSFSGQLYTSDDGIHWTASPLTSAIGTMNALDSGIWMRTNFDPKGDPLWILGGQAMKTTIQSPFSAHAISKDGRGLGSVRFFDERHFTGLYFADLNPGGSGGTARLESLSFDHADTFKSTSGLTWTPDHAHEPSAGGSALIRRPAVVAPDEVLFRAPMTTTQPFAFPHPAALRLAQQADLAPTPFADTQKPIPIRDIYQLSNRSEATGPLREGRYAGRNVKIKCGKPHNFHGPGSGSFTYGDPEMTLSDAKTGKKLGVANSGLSKTTSIAYGYYVFVVMGAIGNATGISYTENGLDWKVVMTGKPGSFGYCLVVGARPEE